jgi:hypothetical protein
MYKSFKIKTALLICLAFVFRLLFFNIGAYASLNSPSGQRLSDHHSSVLKKKRRKELAASVKSPYASEQQVQALAEESQESEEDDYQFKKASFLFILFSFLKGAFNATKSLVPFDRIKCQLQPKKFLALSVIRI